MNLLTIIQVITAVLLVVVVLLQKQGSGLGGVLGGGDGGNSFSTKRGAEKILFYLTIVFSIIFLGTALLAVII